MVKKYRRYAVAIISLLVIATIVLWVYHKWHHKPHATKKPQPIAVKVYRVNMQNVPLTVTALGEILAPHSVMLKAQQAGLVTKILVKPGEKVDKDQLLMTLGHTEELAQLKQQQANLWAAKLNYQRQLKLSQRDPGSVSQMDLDTLLSKVHYDEATVAYANEQYQDTFVRAPFAGFVAAPETILGQTDSSGNSLISITQIAPGAYVDPTQPLMAMVGLQKLEVSYQLPQSYMSQAKIGQLLHLKSNAYPHQTFQATVDYISLTVDMINRTINVRGALHTGQQVLKPGSLVEVKQILQAKHQVLAVPAIALIPSLAGYQLYVVHKGRAQRIDVTVGQRDQQWVAVRSGLQVGDQVITAGQNSVHPGEVVRVVSP